MDCRAHLGALRRAGSWLAGTEGGNLYTLRRQNFCAGVTFAAEPKRTERSQPTIAKKRTPNATG